MDAKVTEHVFWEKDDKTGEPLCSKCGKIASIYKFIDSWLVCIDCIKKDGEE